MIAKVPDITYLSLSREAVKWRLRRLVKELGRCGVQRFQHYCLPSAGCRQHCGNVFADTAVSLEENLVDLILVVIIACEIGFWAFVLLGLVARYALQWRRVSTVLLAMVPVIDIVLLAAVVINLRGGGTATFFHGLAALYLGVSIAYGHKMIKWADVRFARLFAQGPAPIRLYGSNHAKESWRDVARTTLAVGIAAAILWLLTVLVDDADRTRALLGVYPVLGIWWVIDLFEAVVNTFSPRKRPAATEV